MKLYPRTKKLKMLDGRRRAWQVERGKLYRVFGREGCPYTIPVRDGVPLCPCPAGSGCKDGRVFRPRACWHAALVLMRLQRERLVDA